MVDILQRIIATKSFKFEKGAVTIWGIPVNIYSLFSMTYLGRLLEKGHSGKDLLYWAGYHQSKASTYTMTHRFGYKKKLIESVVAHGEMLGIGKTQVKQVDVNALNFIFHTQSEYAKEYVAHYGKQTHPVCHYLRGQNAGLIETLYPKTQFLTAETQCIAKGDKYCEFVVKPAKEWTSKEAKALRQKPLPTPEELGYQVKRKDLPHRH